MVDTVKTIFKRASGLLGMNGLFRSESWPAGVLEHLEVKYHLKPEDMLRLGYLRRKISENRHSFYSLFIYDRLAARDRKLLIRDVGDIYNTPELLLYKGNIFGDGSVHLSRVKRYENN